ncbi:MAG TPA: hypothetical protein DHN33_06810 [Eubacteriaceae bacterium]|nr:hypothetical protein [Eubacteriaceae bacterium]
MKLNTRQMAMANALIEHPQLSPENMARKFDISLRTVYRDINKLSDWIFEKGWMEENSFGKLLEKFQDPSFTTMLKKEMNDYSAQPRYTQQDRMELIVMELMLQSEPIKSYLLAQKFGVSEKTVLADLDKCEEWIRPFGLMIEKRPGQGITVRGDEKNVRRMIMDLFYRGNESTQVRETFQELVESKKEEARALKVENRMLGLVSRETIRIIGDQMNRLEEELKENFTDEAYIGLMIHIILAVYRIQNGEKIGIQDGIFEKIKDSKEYQVAQRATKHLENLLGLAIPESEIAYITMHLQGAKIAKKTGEGTREETIKDETVIRLVKRMLDEAKRVAGHSFEQDGELIKGLMIHLKPALSRMVHGMEIRNPLLSQIQKQYQEIYQLAQKVAHVLEEELKKNVPEEEIGYLAMHLGASIERNQEKAAQKKRVLVVCPSGIGTSRWLTTRVKQSFEELEVVGHVPIHEVEDALLEGARIDVVISTVDLGQRDFDYVVVNPLLPEEDRFLLENYFGILSKEKQESSKLYTATEKVNRSRKQFDLSRLKEYLQAFDGLLETFGWKEKVSVTHQKELTRFLAKAIHGADKSLVAQLEEELARREQLGATLVPGSGLALVHGRSKTTDGLVGGVYRLKNPVDFRPAKGEKEEVDTVLLLVISSEASKGAKEAASHISALLLEEPGFVELLRRQSREAVFIKMKEIYEEFVKKYVKSCL